MQGDDRTARIRALNDKFRTTWDRTLGRFVITPGINGMEDAAKSEAFVRVITFSDFNSDNDPRGEHDFGNFQVGEKRIFWKIDYYDPTLQYGSEDPTDPGKTTRVLSIMFAEEY
jgi:hypothetical protein